MNLLSKLKSIMVTLQIPVETGDFSDAAPDTYVVMVPITDTFDLHADNQPEYDIQSVRISLFTKGNYTKLKNRIIKALLAAGMTIDMRQYVGFESDTKYYHYNIDVEDVFEMEEL